MGYKDEHEEQYNRMLARLARTLGKTADDETLADALEDAIDTVLVYCNIEEIPRLLESTVVQIARDMWRAEGYGQEAADQQATQVKRGDVTTTFAAPGTETANPNTGAGFVKAYQRTLNQFRVTRFGPRPKGGC